jgi:hypothetical protein
MKRTKLIYTDFQHDVDHDVDNWQLKKAQVGFQVEKGLGVHPDLNLLLDFGFAKFSEVFRLLGKLES